MSLRDGLRYFLQNNNKQLKFHKYGFLAALLFYFFSSALLFD